MSTTNRPPLWEAMDDARLESCLAHGFLPRFTPRADRAAEIRAIAEWLEAMWAAQGPPLDLPVPLLEGLNIGMKMHREGTLNILRAEADRAEAGQ